MSYIAPLQPHVRLHTNTHAHKMKAQTLFAHRIEAPISYSIVTNTNTHTHRLCIKVPDYLYIPLPLSWQMSNSNPPISPLVCTSAELNNIIHVGAGRGGGGLWEKGLWADLHNEPALSGSPSVVVFLSRSLALPHKQPRSNFNHFTTSQQS